MTKGSWIHDDLVRHLKACAQCRAVQPEDVRVAQPKARRRTVPDGVLAKMCSDGRSIYRSYLRWLAEPDDG